MRRTFSRAAVVVFICSFAYPLLAQGQDTRLFVPSLAGTVEVSHARQQRGGRLEGCSLIYSTIVQDFAYAKGDYVLANGSFTFYAMKDQPVGFSLKVGLKQSNGSIEAPSFAYLQFGNKNTASSATHSSASDTPGYALWMGAVTQDVSAVLSALMQGETVTLGFSRTKGGIDTLAPINIEVASTTRQGDEFVRQYSETASFEFAYCMKTLIAQAKAELSR
jgi:hypothetical protein